MYLLVSELGVLDQRSDKETENWWIRPKFNFIQKYNNFLSMRSSP